jgi:hypothetical protein
VVVATLLGEHICSSYLGFRVSIFNVPVHQTVFERAKRNIILMKLIRYQVPAKVVKEAHVFFIRPTKLTLVLMFNLYLYICGTAVSNIRNCDDFFHSQLESHSDILLNVVTELGFYINFEKSELDGSQCCLFRVVAH